MVLFHERIFINGRYSIWSVHHTNLEQFRVVTVKTYISKQVSIVRVTVAALIGLYIRIHILHSVHNNVGVRSFID